MNVHSWLWSYSVVPPVLGSHPVSVFQCVGGFDINRYFQNILLNFSNEDVFTRNKTFPWILRLSSIPCFPAGSELCLIKAPLYRFTGPKSCPQVSSFLPVFFSGSRFFAGTGLHWGCTVYGDFYLGRHRIKPLNAETQKWQQADLLGRCSSYRKQWQPRNGTCVKRK